jgi:hypothetical protein
MFDTRPYPVGNVAAAFTRLKQWMTPRGIGVWIVVVRGLMSSAQGAMATNPFSSKSVPVRYAFSAETQDCVLCPSWVNRVTLTVGRPLPVYPDQRTSSDRPGVSGWCQEETPALQKRCGDSTNDEAAN